MKAEAERLSSDPASTSESDRGNKGPIEPVSPWKIDVNERYVRVVDLVVGLATGCLILPILFLREILGLKDQPIAIFLDARAFWSLGLFLGSIALGVCFQYASAKWIKEAWGQPVRFIGSRLESLMDSLFWLIIASFVAGLILFIDFALHA